MKVTKFLVITIGTLFFLNIYLGYTIRTTQLQMNERISSLILETRMDSLKLGNTLELLRLEYFLEEKNLVYMPVGTELLEKTNHIVVLFSEEHCLSCVKEIIMNFSYLKQETGYNRFAVLGVFQDSLTFIHTAGNLDAEFTHVYLGPFHKDFAKVNSPVVFTIDMEGRIGYFYSPDVYPGIRQWYFMDLLKRYCIQMN